MNLGAYQMGQGNNEEAIRLFKEALQISPLRWCYNTAELAVVDPHRQTRGSPVGARKGAGVEPGVHGVPRVAGSYPIVYTGSGVNVSLVTEQGLLVRTIWHKAERSPFGYLCK